MTKYHFTAESICDYPKCNEQSIVFCQYENKKGEQKKYFCEKHFRELITYLKKYQRDEFTKDLENHKKINRICWNCKNKYLNGQHNEYRCSKNQKMKYKLCDKREL